MRGAPRLAGWCPRRTHARPPGPPPPPGVSVPPRAAHGSLLPQRRSLMSSYVLRPPAPARASRAPRVACLAGSAWVRGSSADARGGASRAEWACRPQPNPQPPPLRPRPRTRGGERGPFAHAPRCAPTNPRARRPAKAFICALPGRAGPALGVLPPRRVARLFPSFLATARPVGFEGVLAGVLHDRAPRP